jgi:hypothetical protein
MGSVVAIEPATGEILTWFQVPVIILKTCRFGISEKTTANF